MENDNDNVVREAAIIVQQHDNSEKPRNEDPNIDHNNLKKMVKFGPSWLWKNQDLYRLLKAEATYFARLRFPNISSTLNRVRVWLRWYLKLREATRILNPKMQFYTIKIGDKKDGIFSKEGVGIDDKNRKRRRLIGIKKSNIKALQKLTHTYIFTTKLAVAVVGESKRCKIVRQVVDDCMLNRKHHVSHLRHLKRFMYNERKNKKKNKIKNSNNKVSDDQKIGTTSTVEIDSLCDSLKLLDVSSEQNNVLLTTYGKLQPPLGMRRLKAVGTIAGLLTAGGDHSEAVLKELIRLGGVRRILDLFFQYPYNNFLHLQVVKIIISCLESKIDAPDAALHLLHECDLVGKILEAEKSCALPAESSNYPTVAAEGKTPPRMGNIGHLTHISNRIVELGNENSKIQAYLKQNSEWTDWCTNVLSERCAVENVFEWKCGHPLSQKFRRTTDITRRLFSKYHRIVV